MFVVKIGMPIASISGQTSGGPLGVGRGGEPRDVDPPANAAHASRWEAELEQAPSVRFRKRYDHGEARKTRQQHGVVQGPIAMVRGRGKRQWDPPADCPE